MKIDIIEIQKVIGELKGSEKVILKRLKKGEETIFNSGELHSTKNFIRRLELIVEAHEMQPGFPAPYTFEPLED